MTKSAGLCFGMFWAIGLTAGAAFAEEKVEVMASVVLASNQGTAVEPSTLSSMKAKFVKEGFAFSSFKQLTSQKLALVRHKAQEVHLPNGKVATLELEEILKGVAKVKVQIPPTHTLYSLGREGSVFIDADKYENGTLVFVLSPIEGARHPRSAGGAMRPTAAGQALYCR